MTGLRKLPLYILLIGTLIIGVQTSCTKSRTSTDKRIKKQKQRQKSNPGGCPRIDCLLLPQQTEVTSS